MASCGPLSPYTHRRRTSRTYLAGDGRSIIFPRAGALAAIVTVAGIPTAAQRPGSPIRYRADKVPVDGHSRVRRPARHRRPTSLAQAYAVSPSGEESPVCPAIFLQFRVATRPGAPARTLAPGGAAPPRGTPAIQINQLIEYPQPPADVHTRASSH